MKRRTLERKIFEAYKAETPDLINNIVKSCENEDQESASVVSRDSICFTQRFDTGLVLKRVCAAAACFVLFVFGMLLGRITQTDEGTVAARTAETFVYFDVNPSIELQMDGENKVVECLAGNADAEVVLSGLALDGVDMNTALTALVGSMYVNGYLTENSNSILISVETADSEKESMLLSDIAAKINSVFEKSAMECSIIAQSVKVDDSLKQRAQENGISVGKMHLLDKMAEGFGGLSENAIKKLSELSISDLNLIYLQKPFDGLTQMEEFVSGAVNVAVSSEEAINSVLVEMGKSSDDVECYRVFFLPSSTGEYKVVYAVLVKLYDDKTIYKYEVDCQTGAVVKTNEYSTE